MVIDHSFISTPEEWSWIVETLIRNIAQVADDWDAGLHRRTQNDIIFWFDPRDRTSGVFTPDELRRAVKDENAARETLEVGNTWVAIFISDKQLAITTGKKLLAIEPLTSAGEC